MTSFAVAQNLNGSTLQQSNRANVDSEYLDELNNNADFHIVAHVGESRIKGLSAYMTILKLLHDQALDDFNAELHEAFDFRFRNSEYEDVEIIFTPVHGVNVARKYFVYALFQGLCHMAKRRFVKTNFYLYLGEEVLGFILISPWSRSGDRALQSPNTAVNTSDFGTTVNISASDSGNSTRLSDRNFEVEVSYLSNAATLSLAGVLCSFAATFAHLAGTDKYAPPSLFTLEHDVWGTLVAYTLGESQVQLPNYAVIDSIWRAILFVIGQRRFSELQAEINSHGRTFARLTLSKLHRSVRANANSTASFATS